MIAILSASSRRRLQYFVRLEPVAEIFCSVRISNSELQRRSMTAETALTCLAWRPRYVQRALNRYALIERRYSPIRTLPDFG